MKIQNHVQNDVEKGVLVIFFKNGILKDNPFLYLKIA